MKDSAESHFLEFAVDRELLAAATRRFWLQFVGVGGLIRWFISALLGTGCAVVSHWQWLIPFVAAISLATPAVWVTGYVTALRRAITRLDQMPSKRIAYKFTEEGVEIKSDLGKGESPWRVIDRVQRYSDVWLLFYGTKTYIYLPTALIDDATKAFIIAQASKHGAKIT